MNTAATGTLYGVGVGPGDPELITVKAYRMIQECAVVAYPKKRRGQIVCSRDRGVVRQPGGKGDARTHFSNDQGPGCTGA